MEVGIYLYNNRQLMRLSKSPSSDCSIELGDVIGDVFRR
jgi:hypothetical protein